MMSCGWRRQELLIYLIFAYVLLAVRAQDSYHDCYGSNNNYTRNGAYATNLNAVLSSLYTNINDSGFYATSAGQNQSIVNALALCRADLQLQTCRSCIQNATVDILISCPNQMKAIIWNKLCTVRFSNESILRTPSTDPGYWAWNLDNVTSPVEFQVVLRSLLDELRDRAANGRSLWKVAGGNRTGPDFMTIFAIVQCTPDLSSDDCNSCLIFAANQLPKCCDRRTEAEVFEPSCNLQYEITPFFNGTRLLEIDQVPSVPAPPPTGPPAAVAPLPAPDSRKKDATQTIIIIIVSVISFIIVLVVITAIFLHKRAKKRLNANTEYCPPNEDGDDMSSVESLQYDFNEIRTATNDFFHANKLGEGGFGSVYKGKLVNGRPVAVKRLLRRSEQGDMEFKNEVVLLARLQHRNLVRLLGFALEGIEKLLVFEFVENASLDKFIFDLARRSALDWDTRYKIIGGIVRGLLYLHEDSRLRIIHRDLKASNILLDADMNPKIADFGMARLFTNEIQGNTSKIVGTYGYMAPEYFAHGLFSVKSDVYSFGVLVLEVISGHKVKSFHNGEIIEDLISWAWSNWREGTAANIIDPALGSASGISLDMLRCIHIGLLCVQENASDRPTMASVILMLNSSSVTLPTPSKPAFLIPYGDPSEHSTQTCGSITELHPR